MRRSPAVLTMVLLAVTLLTGCSEEQTAPPADPVTIEITFADGTVTPNGERVEVDAGQEIDLVVKADEPGALHVHTTQEQELEYGAGTTTLKLTIDEPGVVEVEDHHTEQVVVQLAVR